jgi:dephospho-CoA kinase
MTVVCVTGLIGSGKTTFCKMLQDAGATYLSADVLVRDLYLDSKFASVVEGILGQPIRTATGDVDTKKIADIIFSNPAMKENLESFIHPQVQAILRKSVNGAATAVTVVEIPVLREVPDYVDVTVLVEAAHDIRVARLVSRGILEEDALRRISAQESDVHLVNQFDLVVSNNQGEESLRDKAEFLFSKWSA